MTIDKLLDEQLTYGNRRSETVCRIFYAKICLGSRYYLDVLSRLLSSRFVWFSGLSVLQPRKSQCRQCCIESNGRLRTSRGAASSTGLKRADMAILKTVISSELPEREAIRKMTCWACRVNFLSNPKTLLRPLFGVKW